MELPRCAFADQLAGETCGAQFVGRPTNPSTRIRGTRLILNAWSDGATTTPLFTRRTTRQVVASVVERTDLDGKQAHTLTVVGSTVEVPTHSSTGCDDRRSGDDPSDPFVVCDLDRPIFQYDVLAVCQPV